MVQPSYPASMVKALGDLVASFSTVGCEHPGETLMPVVLTATVPFPEVSLGTCNKRDEIRKGRFRINEAYNELSDRPPSKHKWGVRKAIVGYGQVLAHGSGSV